MFSLGSSHRFYLYDAHCDMQKSFDGLCGLVISVMQRQPTSGEVFVFLNRSRAHIKLLHWEYQDTRTSGAGDRQRHSWSGSTGADSDGQIHGPPAAVPPETDLRPGKHTDSFLHHRRMNQGGAAQATAALRSVGL